MQNSACTCTSPNSASVTRLTVCAVALFTMTPRPGAMTKLSRFVGSRDTLLAPVHVPVGLRQPVRSLPLNRTTAPPAARLDAGAKPTRTAANSESEHREGFIAAGKQ